jgi:hypothetical protein
MLRQAAEKTGDDVGDGTSTSTILAHAIFADGLPTMSVLGQTRPWAAGGPTSDLTPIADSNRLNPLVSEVPGTDRPCFAMVTGAAGMDWDPAATPDTIG